MPIFTEGHDPLDHQDPLNFFRSGPSPADLARAHVEWEAQRQYEANSFAVCMIALAVIVLLAAYCVALHRRKIARAADTALIAGLATGVRAARKVASKKDALKARVLAKADETTSRPD